MLRPGYLLFNLASPNRRIRAEMVRSRGTTQSSWVIFADEAECEVLLPSHVGYCKSSVSFDNGVYRR